VAERASQALIESPNAIHGLLGTMATIAVEQGAITEEQRWSCWPTWMPAPPGVTFILCDHVRGAGAQNVTMEAGDIVVGQTYSCTFPGGPTWPGTSPT